MPARGSAGERLLSIAASREREPYPTHAAARTAQYSGGSSTLTVAPAAKSRAKPS